MPKSITCACGVTYKTPHGEDDAVAFAQWHVQRAHPADFPQGISREEAVKMIVDE